MDSWRQRARALKREVDALWLALRDPRTPWYGRALAALVVAYAFSPIDLIPDFVPILGYLDDLLLVPLGVWLALRLIPPAVLAEAQAQAAERADRPVSGWGAALVVLVWLALAAAGAYWLWQLWPAPA